MSEDFNKEYPGSVSYDPLSFALYGLDRDLSVWTQPGPKPWLNLGPGNKHIADTEELDWPGWDAEKGEIPYPDEFFGAVFATHFLEHVGNIKPLLREVGRVLRPSCPFNILVPHADSLMYKHDLDHKHPFVIDTWENLLGNPYYSKDPEGFPFRVTTNFLFGLKEKSLALVTQLVKIGEPWT